MGKIIKEVLPYIIIVIVVITIRTFLITPVRVSGTSMYPTLEDKQIMILNKVALKFSSIKRFDIIVLNYEESPLVKRVIGLPGEKIEYKNNQLYVNNKKANDKYGDGKTNDFTLDKLEYDVIPNNMYLVLGDNRETSADSRVIGLIKKDNILGKTSLVIWPLNKIGFKK